MFWEPSTGERFEVTDPTALERGCPYDTVDCVFNDSRLYANRQVDNSAALTRYNLQDAALWCELRIDREKEVPGCAMTGLQLEARRLDIVAIEVPMGRTPVILCTPLYARLALRVYNAGGSSHVL